MKKGILMLLSTAIMWTGVQAQEMELEVQDTEVELSKDGKRAARKDQLSYMGAYWNAEQTELYSFYMYQPKEGPAMMDVAVFNTQGELQELRTQEFSAENLSSYNLGLSEEIENNGGSQAGKKVGYFKRPTLPGRPTLNIGHFENRYTNGLWTGYDFEEDEDTKIEPKFWPFFTVALGGNQDGNDHYLLKKVNSWSRLFEGNRTYVAMDEKVVIGGQKAEMVDGEARVFYLGTFNMATLEWERGEDIDMGSAINPGLWAYHQDEAGNVHCLVGTEEAFYVLQVDSEGNYLHKVKLSLPVKGNVHAAYFAFRTEGNTLYVA
jgi:hypothetical protein